MRHRSLAVGLAVAVALTATPAAALAKPAAQAKGNGAQHKVVKDKLAKDRAKAHQRITRETAKLPADEIFHTSTPRMRAAVDAASNAKQLRRANQANARHLARLKSAGARNTALQQDGAALLEDSAALVAAARDAVTETDAHLDVVAAAQDAAAVAAGTTEAVEAALAVLPTLDTAILRRAESLLAALRADLDAAAAALEAAVEDALAPVDEEPVVEEPVDEEPDEDEDELV